MVGLSSQADNRRADAERRRRIRQLGIAAVLAVVLVAVVVAIGQSGAGGNDEIETAAAEAAALFDGIPQEGTSLGDPDAELEMVEFADPQCPFCADYAREALPAIVERYVQPGDLRLDLEPLAFIGPESERAARVVVAAGEQGRAWELADLLYWALDAEGELNEELIREAAEATPGLDAERALREAEDDAVGERLSAAAVRADELGVTATPSFFVARGESEPRQLEVAALDPDAFTEQLDALVAEAAQG